MKEHRQAKSGFQQVAELIFYGNYFYGICAVAIMLETAVQLKLPYDGPLVYMLAFVATVLFYNYPYARKNNAPSENPRALWYRRHHGWVVRSQWVLTMALMLLLALLFMQHGRAIRNPGSVEWLLLLVFPVAGGMYYGANFLSRKRNLRQIGWLKPFVIGFVWAGVANVYPILYHNLLHDDLYELTFQAGLLFLKTFMFVSMLAIMFDIKDYEADSRNQLNTLVVKFGLRKTILYVVVPLTLLGLLTFLSYAVTHDFSLLKMALMMIPFFLLLAAARSFRKRRTLLYYLVVIDGLFIVKACFGILATLV
ncbi:MAG: UbiA family prenyltransferase [Saprospiraceae bacterium]|nr:UbiA family prenyltransferase [Saprospiraceae bacterium]